MRKEKLICGVDLGGTKLAVALFEQDGTIVGRDVIHDHSDCDGDGIIGKIAALLKKLFLENGVDPNEDILGVGVALAGSVLFREGLVITTSNFAHCIKDFPFVEKLSAFFPGVKIILDNDANAQALGEYKFGAGRGYGDQVFVTVSTGIGGGIIINGKLYRGFSGTAGEVGHSIVDIDSDMQCTCGNYGCSMALASGLFFPELYRRELRKGAKSKIGITEENADKLNGQAIEEGMLAGDSICRTIVENSADIVGASIFNIFQMLNPELVVLGGGLMAFGDEYVNRIEEKFVAHTHNMMYEPMKIKLAETGRNAGLLGAAALLLE